MPRTKKVEVKTETTEPTVEIVAKKKTKKKPPYSLEIKVNDVEFKTDAENLTVALTEFVQSPVFPLGAKTLAIVKIAKGKVERQEIWQTPKARRLFRIIGLKPSALEVLGARLEASLN